jgi:hypothetical protein
MLKKVNLIKIYRIVDNNIRFQVPRIYRMYSSNMHNCNLVNHLVFFELNLTINILFAIKIILGYLPANRLMDLINKIYINLYFRYYRFSTKFAVEPNFVTCILNYLRWTINKRFKRKSKSAECFLR